MSIRTEIANESWKTFCDGYSREHLGWMVKVDVYDPAMEKFPGEEPPSPLKPLANNLSFQGIVFEKHASHSELLLTIASNGDLFTHRFPEPTHIVAMVTDTGLHEGLLVHDDSGGILQILFREPADPSALDGWMHSIEQ